jgi:hypothetical protein
VVHACNSNTQGAEDLEFKASLDYIKRPYKTKTKAQRCRSLAIWKGTLFKYWPAMGSPRKNMATDTHRTGSTGTQPQAMSQDHPTFLD